MVYNQVYRIPLYLNFNDCANHFKIERAPNPLLFHQSNINSIVYLRWRAARKAFDRCFISVLTFQTFGQKPMITIMTRRRNFFRRRMILPLNSPLLLLHLLGCHIFAISLTSLTPWPFSIIPPIFIIISMGGRYLKDFFISMIDLPWSWTLGRWINKYNLTNLKKIQI